LPWLPWLAGHSDQLSIWLAAVEKPLFGPLRFQVGLYATFQVMADWYIPVFAAFSSTDMEGEPVKVNVPDLKIAQLEAS